ncbi:MAG TPA: hypothetical protein VN716_08850 [Vicinamibacterales bacterium]|nr:hypothetical protein [Vicinamibacterales bacterium]
MSLVRSQPDGDDIDRLRARLTELEAALTERVAEITRARADLAAFRIRYRKEVGRLHEELDDLERAIAEAELGEIGKRLEGEPEAAEPQSASSRSGAAPRFTSDAVRRLFRDVARTVHPDLARDEQARDRRHALMVEANRAYALGDEERLRTILDAWASSPEAVLGSDLDATRERLLRRVAQIEEQLVVYAADLDALRHSPLWQLKAMVDAAAARGKDLVADMIRRLERDIMAARNRLDAMQWNP